MGAINPSIAIDYLISQMDLNSGRREKMISLKITKHRSTSVKL